MKKLFTLIALVAGVCLSMNLSSCGDDNGSDFPEQPSKVTYSIEWSVFGSNAGQAAREVVAYLNSKLGRVGKAEGTALGIIVSATDRAKANAILKSLDKEELDAILSKIEGLTGLSFEISDGKEVLFTYSYRYTSSFDATGTYSYTETTEDGDYEWTATLTNNAGKEEGHKTGAFVLPRDVDGLSAGTYEGEYKVTSSNILGFVSNAKNANGVTAVRLTMDLKTVTEDGEYTGTVAVYGKTVLDRVVFSKK